MLATSLTAIDTFVDALWLEDGLSRNTLAAYRRDLTLYAQWLADQQPPQALDGTAEHHLQGYFAARHAQTRATSANRRLTGLRRYFHWALRERRITVEVSDAAKTFLGNQGYDPVYGARPLKRAIQQRIENPVSKLILQGRFGPKDVIPVDVEEGEFRFTRVVH